MRKGFFFTSAKFGIGWRKGNSAEAFSVDEKQGRSTKSGGYISLLQSAKFDYQIGASRD